jgi:hypothetical protein
MEDAAFTDDTVNGFIAQAVTASRASDTPIAGLRLFLLLILIPPYSVIFYTIYYTTGFFCCLTITKEGQISLPASLMQIAL